MKRDNVLARVVALILASMMPGAPLFAQALPAETGRPERVADRAAWTAPGEDSDAARIASGLPQPAQAAVPLPERDGRAFGSAQPVPDSFYQYAIYPVSHDASNPPAPANPAARGGRVGDPSVLAPGGATLPRQTHAGPEVYSLDVPMNDLIKWYLNYYTSPEGLQWLSIVLKRAEPFRDFVASRIEHYGMPPELVYLPIVESTYNPFAVSYTGAAGLWQFMTNSIDPYNMQINEWLDDRFDFWKSTDASLQKLKYNYDVLGDWLLALAAYNCGLGTMTYIIQKSGSHDLWTLAAQGYLPAETKQYIPKFLAIAAIASYAGRNGIALDWNAPVEWERLKLDQAVDLRILAREAGVSLPLLLEGNAELRYDITPPGGSDYYLKVPAKEASAVSQTLQQQRFKLMRFYIYRIQSGDTLYDLGRYYGVPISMILQYNPGVQARTLQIGTRLVIPGVKEVPPYTRQRAPSAPAPSSAQLARSFTGSYTVQPGDTLWNISLRYSTSPENIAAANGISLDGIIKPGMSLKVPMSSSLVEANTP